MKVTDKGASTQALKDELSEIKSWKSKAPQEKRVEEIAKMFASEKQWDLVIDTLEQLPNEKKRNLLIADLIENFLLPEHEIGVAKKFAKYITPVAELEPFIWIKIALAERDIDQVLKIAEHLPSSLARNYAYLHLMEHYLTNKEKSNADNLHKMMVENIKTIYDSKIRSYILRELALNLFLPFNQKEQALEMAMLIPDDSIRNQVLSKIKV